MAKIVTSAMTAGALYGTYHASTKYLLPIALELAESKNVIEKIHRSRVSDADRAFSGAPLDASAPTPQSKIQSQVADVSARKAVGAVDPSAEERIRNMLIPEPMKQKILSNYRRTGVLPDVGAKASQAQDTLPSHHTDSTL